MVLDQNVQINGDLAIVGGGNDGTLLFYQDAIHPDNLRLAIGEVGGLFGAPSGAVGIAGPLGAGAWFEGVPRLVAAGSILCDATNLGPTVYEPAGGFMVRPGKKWLLQAWPSEIVPPNSDVDWSLQQFYVNAFGRTSPGNASVKGSLPAGSYSNVWISAGAVYLKYDPLSGLLGAVWVNWQILEVDA